MKKNLRNIYYYLKYGSILKNYNTNYKLDVLLVYLNEIGIRSIDLSNTYTCVIVFNDFSNGKTLTWNCLMPSSEILYRFKKIIKAQEKVKKVVDSNFTELLPIKILRKRKLDKIKKTI